MVTRIFISKLLCLRVAQMALVPLDWKVVGPVLAVPVEVLQLGTATARTKNGLQ